MQAPALARATLSALLYGPAPHCMLPPSNPPACRLPPRPRHLVYTQHPLPPLYAGSRHGRATFSVLLFQDLAVVVLLMLIPLLAPGPEGAGGGGGSGMWGVRGE